MELPDDMPTSYVFNTTNLFPFYGEPLELAKEAALTLIGVHMIDEDSIKTLWTSGPLRLDEVSVGSTR